MLAILSMALSAVPVSSALQQVKLVPIGRYETGVFAGGGAEISAYHAPSKRLFVVSGSAKAVEIVDLSDPTTPTKVGTIDLARYGDGPTSVDVGNDLVAVAIPALVKTDPGLVAFFDVLGSPMGRVTVGALPDMVTFDRSGLTLLVANEGEPADDYSVDPEGSISIVDLSKGIGALTQADVHTADFKAFNGTVLPAGIRVFGPGATVAQDLEPEYITVSPRGDTAYVTLQENNALAIVDVKSATVTQLVPFGLKDHSGGILTAVMEENPVLGQTVAGQDVRFGGLSSLFFESRAPDGRLFFVTHADRGPNAEPINLPGGPSRPFPLPTYQPHVLRFELDPVSRDFKLLDSIPLTRQNGIPLTGLPNLLGPTQGLAHCDEIPIDVFGAPLPLDAFGGDLEGMCIAGDGTWWLVDEYRPAIYHFETSGKLIERYVPEGSNASGTVTGVEALPAVFAQRRVNRGFEGCAIDGDKLYAFIQSPLDNPDTPNDASSKASVHGRILEFDTVTKQTTAQYLYVFEGGASDKIGDAVHRTGSRYLVIERDSSTGPDAAKKIFEIDLAGATNLATLDPSIVGPGGTLELMTPAQLAQAGIQAVSKQLVLDLAAAGYEAFEKAEGLALVDENTLAIVHDQDFNLDGTLDLQTGLLGFRAPPLPTAIWLIDLRNVNDRKLDVTDRDGFIGICNAPIFGMYQPDGIDQFDVAGKRYLITANEGDVRDWSAYSEEERIKDLDLDPLAFPDAVRLQNDDAIGRLAVTSANGDTDDDGDHDELWAFGARSVTIWDAQGQLVWDSGDLIERVTARAYPAYFNSSNDDNGSFDTRSDAKGPEPEGVVVGRVGDVPYAFVGLERIGGVVVLDVSDPAAPVFVQYINTRDFEGDPAAGTAGDLGPEGLTFVPLRRSPIAAPLLIVSNEISGSVGIFAVETAP